MSTEAFRDHLTHRLARIRQAIADAERQQSEGDLATSVKAAGQIAVLKRREQEVTAKLDRLATAPPGLWGGLTSEIAEDIDSLGLAVERLFVGF